MKKVARVSEANCAVVRYPFFALRAEFLPYFEDLDLRPESEARRLHDLSPRREAAGAKVLVLRAVSVADATYEVLT